MRKIRDVLRLRAGGMSKRKIAASLSIGVTAAGECVRRARRAGLIWPLPQELSDAALELRLYPPPQATATNQRPQPDWAAIHRELRRPGVTLQLLWEEHRGTHPDGYGYSRYCELYRAWEGRLSPTMRQLHVAGERMFVDYAGTTLEVMDGTTGEARVCQLFVAALGASNYTYAEATFTQRLVDWIGSHVRAFAFFDGVTAQIVSDYVPGNIIVLLCPRRLCGGPARMRGIATAAGHISIRGPRAIRGALAHFAKLVFGEAPPKMSKEPGTLPELLASS